MEETLPLSSFFWSSDLHSPPPPLSPARSSLLSILFTTAKHPPPQVVRESVAALPFPFNRTPLPARVSPLFFRTVFLVSVQEQLLTLLTIYKIGFGLDLPASLVLLFFRCFCRKAFSLFFSLSRSCFLPRFLTVSVEFERPARHVLSVECASVAIAHNPSLRLKQHPFL